MKDDIFSIFSDIYNENKRRMSLLENLVFSLPDEDTRKAKAKSKYVTLFEANKALDGWLKECQRDEALAMIKGE